MADRAAAGDAGYASIWEYEVPPHVEQEFLAHYAPDGSWSRLFGRAPGYLGTELYRDRQRATRFVTVDRWVSGAAYHGFRSAFAADYEALDRSCERLTRREASLGELEAVTGSAPSPR